MSDPYNQYGGQYNQQYPPNQYGSPAPTGQGYPPPQPGYNNDPYAPTHPSYPPAPPQNNAYPGQGYPDPYAQQQQLGYGPPSQGGFQHGQSQSPAPYQDPYQQQNQNYQQYPGAQPANQFPQQGAYPHSQAPYDANNPNTYGQAHQPGGYGATDPNAQQEGDRGLMGALGGGAAGYFGGNKMGGHGIIGALAGAVLGSKLEDKHKKPKHNNGGYH